VAIRSLKIYREDSGRNVEGARDSEDLTKERGTDECEYALNKDPTPETGPAQDWGLG